MTDSRLKTIDITKPLDKDTLEWLRNRNQHELLAAYERNMAGEPAAEPPTPLDPSTPGDEYDKWTVDDLKKEIDERANDLDDDADEETRARLSYGTKDRKDDLISKLRADDQALAE